jgi:hypothetical protein
VALAVRNGERTHRLQVVFALVLVMSTGVELSSIPTAEAPGQVGASGQAYPTTSWAVGLVVPEGASLQGGGKVGWEGVNNLTAAVTLPNITLPDEIVYAVVSVMTSDGNVLQAAAGIWPNDSDWFAYAWLIHSPTSVPLTYQWVLNGSVPAMAPGANVSISIYQASGSWNLRVTDEETGAGLAQLFPSGIGQSVRVGDQEVFALESYSRSGATFRNMGNLTLTGLFLDGLKVTGGVYAYSSWDPTYSPLFAVGSAGASPPSFVSLGQAKDGSFVWGYEIPWSSPNDTLATVEVILVLVSVALVVVGVVLWKTRKTKVP